MKRRGQCQRVHLRCLTSNSSGVVSGMERNSSPVRGSGMSTADRGELHSPPTAFEICR
jgi:hypothetical protein